MTSTARQDILQSIRRNLPEASELPPIDAVSGIEYDDPISQFATVLESVGGRSVRAADADHAQAQLDQLAAWTEADKRLSCVPGIGTSTFDLEAVDDPHELADVDFAVLPGRLAVAENAAVWVTDERVKHRVAFFLIQHLALVVPTDQVVHNMHQAYQQLAFGGRRFGVFISGPSKTADIEQSLVIGAHGPRSLTVFLVDRGFMP